jgi:competence protein ComEC
MRIALLCFALGVGLVQRLAELPDWTVLTAVAAAAALSLVAGGAVFRRGPRTALGLVAAGCVLAGFGYAAARGQWRLADHLPEGNEGRDVEVVGVVSGLPQDFEHGQRFEFEVEDANAELPRRLALAWYKAPPAAAPEAGEEASEADAAPPRVLRAGERWRLTLRLKRPHGSLNPHGFDYEGWLFERGLRATGYVRPRPEPQRLDAFVLRPGTLVERLREGIRERFRAALPDRDHAGVLVALAVGDQRAIDASQWQLFARTGTTHLMSISGLHVTMIGGLLYGLVAALWRGIPALALRLPAQQAGVAAGGLGALAYTLLSGFGVPAQRTLYMLAVVGLALWLRRTTAPSRVLLLALALVLLVDPWAVIAPGFWLSFGAVGLLFFVAAGDLLRRHWLRAWLRAQWAVTLGLIPALLALFQQFSLVSPLANAIAIPVVSLVVTPLTLLAVLVPIPLLDLAHGILAALMAALQWLGALPAAVWQQAAPPPWAVALGLAGCAWLLLPAAFPARWAGAVLLLPLLAIPGPRPPPGALRLTVLDVGQGLAVHAQTENHDLIFDTGPQFSTESDSGERIILPYLGALGVRRLDGLIVSHADRDHAGGAASLLQALPVSWLASSLPDSDPLRSLPVAQRRCEAGQSWEWDGVRFELLHPSAADYRSAPAKSNDLSCVLKLSAAGGSVLLGADIETATEARLLARGMPVRAEHFVVPHHGSRSSSSPDFVAAVGARQAIFPVGYRSRFGHPHPDVLARYAAAGAAILRTDRDGAVTLELTSAGTRVLRERQRSQRYWHGR